MPRMPKYVALLRGINVGGRRSLPMATLKKIVEQAGGRAIATYIQSGNAVFEHSGRSAAKLELDLERRIEKTTSLEVPVALRTAAEWRSIIANNPFPKAGPKALHLVVLKTKVPRGALATLDLDAFLPEEMALGQQHVYLHLPAGMGRAKLPIALERRGGKAFVGTARNWATVIALRDLLET
jgi:uncharacterized protein (DUF1697 family)